MSPSVLLLVLYPVVGMAAPVVFYSLWPKMLPPVPNLAADAVTETEKAATARLGALISLFMYGCLMCATLLWQLFFSVGLDKASFSTNTWLSSALIGGYLGVSWAGVSIWFLALGAATGRMRREIPGLMAPLKVQIAVWLVGALAEETWRVTAIAALVTSRNSPLFSVVAVSVAFGSGCLSLGLQRAAVASLEGVFFGFLFFVAGIFPRSLYGSSRGSGGLPVGSGTIVPRPTEPQNLADTGNQMSCLSDTFETTANQAE